MLFHYRSYYKEPAFHSLNSFFGVCLGLISFYYSQHIQPEIKYNEFSPTLSVLIPIYNDDKYLSTCLDSVLKQDYSSFEVVLVDDGSTDESVAIAKEYAENVSRISLHQHPTNRGSLQARKTAIIHARGKYCCFMDADDYFSTSDALTLMIKLIEKQDVDIVQYSFEIVGPASQKEKQSLLTQLQPYPHRITGAKMILNTCFKNWRYAWNLCGKVYRTSLCKKAVMYIEDGYSVMAEDAYSFFIIAYFASSFKGVRTKPLHSYRFASGVSTGNGISLSRFKFLIKQETDVVDMIYRFLQQTGFFSEYQDVYKSVRRRMFNFSVYRFKNLSLSNQVSGFGDLIHHYPIQWVIRALKWNRTKRVDYLFLTEQIDHYMNMRC